MGWFSELKDKYKKFKSVISPYFSFDKRPERLAITGTWIGVHLLEFGLTYYFVSEAESAEVEDSVSRSLATSFGNILFAATMYAFKFSMSNYLTQSINQSLVRANGLEGWLQNEASVGIEFMQNAEEGKAYALPADTPVERILAEHLKNFSEGTVRLSIENISRLLSSFASLFVIGSLTNAKTASFYFAVGGILVLGCCKLDQEKISMALKSAGYDDTINARFTHFRERAAQVLALGGETLEAKKIVKMLDEKHKLAKRTLKHEFRNNSFMYFTFFGLGPFLSTIGTFAPSFIKAPPTSPVAALLFQQHVFQLMINFFIAMEHYTQKYPKFGASLDKIHDLQSLLSIWKVERLKKALVQEYADSSVSAPRSFVLQNFSINMPTRSEERDFRELLSNVSLNLTPGQYRLLGASNAGKSTTFKAFMGLWPHASGKIIFPCEKNQIRFIPQETFIPYDPTLLEMITYPESHTAEFNRDEIIHLLEVLNLNHLIPTLDQKHNLKMLSRGEQQRLAIISAIIARPKVLLMDEATASIDKENKQIAEKLITNYLPDTLVIIIDHSPLVEPHLADERKEDRIEPVASVVIDIREEQLDSREEAGSSLTNRYALFQPRDIRINQDAKQLELIEAHVPQKV